MSPFAALLSEYIKQAKSLGVPQKALAKAIGVKSEGTITQITDDETKMRLEWLPIAADFFSLRGQEREDFIMEGECTHMPHAVAAAYRRLRREHARLESEVVKLTAKRSQLEAELGRSDIKLTSAEAKLADAEAQVIELAARLRKRGGDSGLSGAKPNDN